MPSIKRHNTFPYLHFEFKDRNGPIDCTPFDVRLVVRDSQGNIVINTVVGAETPAIWDDESAGVGHYEWLEVDTHETGEFQYEFKFNRKADGKDFSIPEKGFFSYSIIEDIELPPDPEL